MEERTALLVGARGLVGGVCLQELLDEPAYGEVLCLVRRPLSIAHPKFKQRLVDFGRLGELPKCDDVFSCVGTTAAKTPSQDEYRRIELGVAEAVAQAALRAGAKRFLLVSSVGADPLAKSFYLSLKGRVEEAVLRLPFQAVHVFRPSFLLGRRAEPRLEDTLIGLAAPFFQLAMRGPLEKYAPVRASAVARAMARAALSGAVGSRVHERASILALAEAA